MSEKKNAAAGNAENNFIVKSATIKVQLGKERRMSENEDTKQPIPTKIKKPVYKKVWFWVVLIVVIIIISASGNKSNTTTSSTTAATQTSQAATVPDVKKERVVSGEAKTLNTGDFVVGQDIKAGLYDVTPASGESGNFFTSGGTNEILGGQYGVAKVRTKLNNNDTVKISGMSTATFTPVTTPFVTTHTTTTLYAGVFTVGEDIGAGRYDVTPGAGESGNLFTSGGTNEILGGQYGVPKTTVDLSDGDTVTLTSMNSVLFTAL